MAIKMNNNCQAGFTLLEVMVALAILGIVLAGVIGMFIATGRYHTSQEMMIEVAQDIRSAKNLMVDEIRSAGCNPAGMLRAGFQKNGDDSLNTDANSIHFTRDIDNSDGDPVYEPDGDADDPNEDIAYFRTSDLCPAGGPVGAVLAAGDPTPGCLRRNTGGGGQAVAPNITELQFQYYDAANTLIPVASLTTDSGLDQIRTVEVTITGQVQNTSRVSTANQSWTQQFRVRVRNL